MHRPAHMNPQTAAQALTIPQAMALATQLQGQGRLQQAEHLLRQILQQQPQHPFALHLLGVIAHQAGNQPAAAELMRRAIALLGGSDFSPTDSVGLKPDLVSFPPWWLATATRSRGSLIPTLRLDLVL